MFEITVCKIMSDKIAKERASKRQILVDHLEASAARNGHEITWDEPASYGSLWKNGREVGIWKIEEV